MPKAKTKPKQPELTLTKTQAEVINQVALARAENRRLFILWYGGIRAGKSTGAAYAMLEHARYRQNKTYMIAAHTQRQGINIFMPIFQQYAAERELKYRGVKGSSPYIDIDGNTFLIVGGSDSGRDMAIQGLTLDGLILDEIPNLNPEFIAQAEARVSGNAALRIYTANKTNPYHWTTLRYYNRALNGEIDAVLIDSNTADNQFVSDDFVAEKEREYDEIHYDRFISNKFRLDKPPIYQAKYQDVDGKPAISVIYGVGGNPIALSAIETGNGYCVVSHTELESGKSPSGLANTILINSERPYMARQLRKDGYAVKAYSGIFEPRRVECTQQATATGAITISPKLAELAQAIDEYNLAGMYPNDGIRCLEVLGEFLTKRKGYAVS